MVFNGLMSKTEKVAEDALRLERGPTRRNRARAAPTLDSIPTMTWRGAAKLVMCSTSTRRRWFDYTDTPPSSSGLARRQSCVAPRDLAGLLHIERA